MMPDGSASAGCVDEGWIRSLKSCHAHISPPGTATPRKVVLVRASLLGEPDGIHAYDASIRCAGWICGTRELSHGVESHQPLFWKLLSNPATVPAWMGLASCNM